MGGLVETEGQMSALAGRTEAGLSEDEARVLGVEAYLYLYSLVTMELTRRQMTNLAGVNGRRLGRWERFRMSGSSPRWSSTRRT